MGAGRSVWWSNARADARVLITSVGQGPASPVGFYLRQGLPGNRTSAPGRSGARASTCIPRNAPSDRNLSIPVRHQVACFFCGVTSVSMVAGSG